MALSNVTIWIAGIMNGYDSTSVSNFQQFTIISVSFGAHVVKLLGTQPVPIYNPKLIMTSMFLGIPLVIGSTFCLGTILGKSAHKIQKSHIV